MITEEQQKTVVVRPAGGLDAVYGIGLVGAWVFYFRRATSMRQRVQAFFKGLFWPGFLVYDVLAFLEKE
ncbi:MAG: hypothetical protein KIS91_17955 [Anaerolineae bacterium]|nr:hypothetical protein [Anaerolineae bacterium]